jgi:uncharacterized membrane protein
VLTERLHKWREDILTSLWFVPVLCGVVALSLSFIMPEVDNLIEQDLEPYRAWIFLGSASAARSMLAAIAQSLITVISLLFSITVLTLHQASVQYTPRVIRNFIRDRANQAMLGVYLGTFIYAILIMRRIRGEDSPGPESVPMISITLALFMALVCLVLLVLFIHHTALSFQASTIIERIHTELVDEMDKLYPARAGDPVTEPDSLDDFRCRHPGPTTIVQAHDSGFVRFIDDDVISSNLRDGEWAIVLPCVGSYVMFGEPLIEVGGAREPVNARMDKLRNAFVLDSERTLTQDVMYGIRQLADIALKGLSPSIHDPTTAEQAIAAAGDALAHLALRQFPKQTRVIETEEDDGETRRVTLWLNRPEYDEYVDEAFSQVRRVAKDNVHVTTYLLDTLHSIARTAQGSDALALQVHVDEILWYLDSHATFSMRDQALIRERANRVLRLV